MRVEARRGRCRAKIRCSVSSRNVDSVIVGEAVGVEGLRGFFAEAPDKACQQAREDVVGGGSAQAVLPIAIGQRLAQPMSNARSGERQTMSDTR